MNLRTHLVEDALKCCSVIGVAVTTGAQGFDADELVDTVTFILRVTLGEDSSGAVQEDTGLRQRRDVAVSVSLRVGRTMVLVTQSPSVDSGGSTGKL